MKRPCVTTKSKCYDLTNLPLLCFSIVYHSIVHYGIIVCSSILYLSTHLLAYFRRKAMGMDGEALQQCEAVVSALIPKCWQREGGGHLRSAEGLVDIWGALQRLVHASGVLRQLVTMISGNRKDLNPSPERRSKLEGTHVCHSLGRDVAVAQRAPRQLLPQLKPQDPPAAHPSDST